MRVLLNCEQTIARMTDYMEGVLTAAQRLQLRFHVSRCRGCRQMLATLEATPRVAHRLLNEETAPSLPEARAAYVAAMERLGAPPRAVEPSTPVPQPLQALLASDPDEPLRLMALAHRSLQSVLPREEDPVLPQEVASELPPRHAWRWQQRGAVRMAELLQDATRGVHLSLMFAPPGVQIPFHSHHGTESLLLLDGEMFDEQGDYQTGDWVHFEEGSRHMPVMGPEGCWCLVREVGGQHFLGPFGWLRNWLAA